MKLRVAILYSPRARASALSSRDATWHDQTQNTVTAVEQALRQMGHYPEPLPSTIEGFHSLASGNYDVVFNLATGSRTKREQANYVAFLESLGVPFTGSGLTTQILCLHKHITKMVMKFHGIPTAAFRIYDTTDISQDTVLDFPVIVKPSSEGSSAGIGPESVIEDTSALKTLISSMLNTYPGPILVEHFLPGREFTVAVMGNEDPVALPPEEIVFDEGTGDPTGHLYTRDVKRRDAITPVCPAKIERALEDAIKSISLKTYRALGCRGYARVDIRLDEKGVPCVLEVNSLPGLEPGFSEFPRIAKAVGMSYGVLIERILQYALDGKSQDQENG